jgi:hypothetical protein
MLRCWRRRSQACVGASLSSMSSISIRARACCSCSIFCSASRPQGRHCYRRRPPHRAGRGDHLLLRGGARNSGTSIAFLEFPQYAPFRHLEKRSVPALLGCVHHSLYSRPSHPIRGGTGNSRGSFRCSLSTFKKCVQIIANNLGLECQAIMEIAAIPQAIKVI